MAIGRGERLRDGHEACVLTIGPVADEAASAIDSLAVRGHSIAHYDMVFAKPLDETIMREVAEKGLPVITVEDGIASGGMGSAVVEWLADHDYTLPVRRVGPDGHGLQGALPIVRHASFSARVADGNRAMSVSSCGAHEFP